MVKGVTRRVVVVRGPDDRLFEQAIFLLREEARDGITQEALLREACQAANDYVRRENGRRPRRSLAPLPAALLGGGITSLGWLAGLLLLS